MYSKLITAAIAFLSCIIATAQTIVSTSEEYDASPAGIVSNNSGSMLDYDYTHSVKRAVLHIGSNEAVMFLKKHKQDGGNIIKINSAGKIVWDVTMKDAVLFTGLYKNAILVLTVPDWNDDNDNTTIIKSIKATLIDVVKGTASAEKVLWQGESGVYIDPKVLSLKDGTFKGLLLRYTNADKKRYSKTFKEYNAKGHASKMEWLSYHQSLEQPALKTLSGNATSDEFLGCDVNSKGELFLVTCTNSAITAEKYTAGATTPVTKAVTYYEAYDEWRKAGEVSCNAESDEQVAVAFRYMNTNKGFSIIAANFDMASGKGYNYVTELNKDYRKQLDLRNADDLRVHEILFYKDKIIVAKEIESSFVPASSGRAVRYQRYETLLSVYDNQMKLQKDIVVPRSLELFVDAQQMNSGYYLNKNILTILYNNLEGVAKNATKIATIDLDHLTLTANTILEREPIGKWPLVEAEAALWFDKTLVLPYIKEHGLSGWKDRTTFQVVKL